MSRTARRRQRAALAIATLCALSTAGCGARLSANQHDLVTRAYAGQPGSGTPGGNAGARPGNTNGLPNDPGALPNNPGATAAPGNPTNPGATAAPNRPGQPVASGPAVPGARPVTGPAADPSCAVPGGRGGVTDTGVTANTLTIANVADISGPVPGLFESARQATTAFVAYWNATYGGVCGRALKVVNHDSRTDANGHREAYLQACESSFAVVGSMSAFDSGGAGVAEQCGIVDIPAVPVTREHQNSRVTYGAAAQRVGIISSTLPKFIGATYPQAVSKAAYIYVDAGASSVNAEANIRAYEKYGHGWDFVYTAAIDVSTFNYSPYVQQMKDKGVRFVQFLGAYQQAAKLAQAMRDQGFKPDMYLLDPTAYNPEFVKQGGPAVEGAYVYTDAGMFEDGAANPEMQLYVKWLKQVAPTATPSYFGMFAWSGARLFATEAAKVGPNLTRKALLDRLKAVRGWTANGMHAPQDVGKKMTPECWGFIQLRGGAWHRAHPTTRGYSCNPLTSE